MEVYIRDEAGVTVVEFVGELDGHTAPVVQDQVLPLVAPGVQLIIDMSALEYMSSAGLRTMLLLHRQFSAQGGQIVLAGLNDTVHDTMSATGFLDFFALSDTWESGMDAFGN